ncbi:hypothetical protein ACCO45_011385 [Purpureocillium lilacinum]|uniref:Uncharacterized protein n=1 Tax=Purpureocillium lilacinum TaxID=33203 RepID=A0ACC4DHJ3_PURLI
MIQVVGRFIECPGVGKLAANRPTRSGIRNAASLEEAARIHQFHAFAFMVACRVRRAALRNRLQFSTIPGPRPRRAGIEWAQEAPEVLQQRGRASAHSRGSRRHRSRRRSAWRARVGGRRRITPSPVTATAAAHGAIQQPTHVQK